MTRKPRPPSPLKAFLTSMAELREARRKLEIEHNRERLRMQVWPQPKRTDFALRIADAAWRLRKAEATAARGNLLGHMLGYPRTIESSGLPGWCLEVQHWQRKLLDEIVVYRRGGAMGAPTAANSFVVTEPYVYDEGASSLPIWRRGLAAHKLCVMRLPDDWRICGPASSAFQIFLVAPREMFDRIREFARVHNYTKPHRPKRAPEAPPDMSNVRDILSKRTASP